jgi:hypothetical protein
MTTIPRRSFLGLLLAAPMGLTAVLRSCPHPAHFSVAMCGYNPGLTEIIHAMLRYALGQQLSIAITEETFMEPLTARSGSIGRPAFDLLIIFFNPHLAASREWRPPPGPADLELLARLRTRCSQPPLVIHNEWAGYTTDQFLRSGAGAVLPMPFSPPEFADALSSCLDLRLSFEAVGLTLNPSLF